MSESNGFSRNGKISFLFVIAMLSVFVSTSPGYGRGSADAGKINPVWEAYDSFNRVYLDSVKFIYRNTNRDPRAIDRWNGAAAIWCQPMYLDMAMNASLLAKDKGDKRREKGYRELARKIAEGNINHYSGFDFDNGNTNTGWFIYDDIQWWTITLARAAEFFKDDRYRTLAERSFARVWYGSSKVGDTGSYASPEKDLGGGMFWQWQPLENPESNKAGHGKMACINFPTVVAAMLLYEITPKSRKADGKPEKWSNRYGDFTRPAYETKRRYLEMAKEIYEWSVKNLVDTVTGMVNDNRHVDRLSGHPLLYNQGTFIGGSMLLYNATGDVRYLNLAKKGADYSIKELSKGDGYLPWAHDLKNPYSQGSMEQGIYPAIWGQYMRLLCDIDKSYLPFIERNVKDGWSNRDKASGICDGESRKVTPADTIIGSYAASSIPSLMLLFP